MPVSKEDEKKEEASTSSNVLETQLETVLQLVTRPQADFNQVDSAVQTILASMGAPAPPPATTRNNQRTDTIQRQEKQGLINDMGNYDDSSEEEPSRKTTAITSSPPRKKARAGDGDDDDQDAANTSATTNISEEALSKYQESLEDIPMGRMGAQMMTTFGDGPFPDPEALQAALLGTRKILQYAIQDARAIRRRARETYLAARKTVAKRRSGGTVETADPEWVFRAATKGVDELAKNPKCGFDSEQLMWLYPEEMRAYEQWNNTFSEYQKNSSEKQGEDAETDNPSEKQQQDGMDDDFAQGEPVGGHLQDRAANFDSRTDRMTSGWYIKFSKVRQGSFLPRTGVRNQKDLEKQWESMRPKKGRIAAGTWESMSVSSVRFLHWLGFNPPTIYPPDEDTTQALGFLGYDMLGRIVEKAIFLRKYGASNEVLELGPAEQLTKEDIERAMDDPDIKPALLHSTGNDDAAKAPSLQLYFGPGFEQRIEIEMEELSREQGKDGVTEEEKQIRQEEAAVFARMSVPPTEDGLATLLKERKGEENTNE